MNGTTRKPRDEHAVDQAAERGRRDAAERGQRAGLTSARSSSAMTTVLSAMIDPTDRSMPPATITIVMPSAADADDRRLPRHQLEVGRREELRPDQRRRRSTATSTQADERSGALEQRSRRHAPRAPRSPSIISSCSDRARQPGSRAPQAAAAHDRDAIAQAEQLRQVAADHQHRACGRRAGAGVGDERVDAARRSAPCCRRRSARRLVEHQHVDVVVQQPRRSRPSAGCRPTARRLAARARRT